MSPVNPIPKDHHSITPSLTVKGAAQAIEFYKKAFGATEKGRFAGPDGLIMHAEIKIGDSIIFLVDESPMMGNKSPLSLGGVPITLHLYTEDCDTVFNRAISAGAKSLMPLADQFWGDRWGMLQDPYGHQWGIATHKEDLTTEQMIERSKAAFASMGQK
ncbi:MAG TPA: VOC family protein [Candidatus Udaeobacter sp.]|nr:VOC family protein [Candidatus Udaeobacter sp.]